MKDLGITKARGMNKPNEPQKTMGAKHRGVVTDGVDLSKGYKTVSPEGKTPEAVPQNKG